MKDKIAILKIMALRNYWSGGKKVVE